MGRLCNNAGFRWVIRTSIVVAVIIGGWLAQRLVFSTQIKADVKAIDTKVEGVKEDVAKHEERLKKADEFREKVQDDISKITIAQTAIEKDVQYMREGQNRQEKMLEKIDDKLDKLK